MHLRANTHRKNYTCAQIHTEKMHARANTHRKKYKCAQIHTEKNARVRKNT
jgi:hypothetical protein